MSSEDRGVQVEARTLSGVHVGQRVKAGRLPFQALVAVEQHSGLTRMLLGVWGWVHVQPTDLVTLTDGGAR